MKKISVIISVYNCEEYLDECLVSLENQTMAEKDIEVIIINDGSKDNSLDIIKKYIKKHKDWKLISRENKGLSVSRNEGLDIMNSEYVTFLDSDDYLIGDALENMYNEVKSNNAEIGLFKTKRFTSKKVVDDSYSDKFDSFNTTINLKTEKRLASFIRSVAILYSKDIISDIRFIPKVIHEDNYFCIKSFSKADRIYVSKSYVYMIREREGSNLSITQSSNLKTYKDLCKNITMADLEIRNKDIIKIHVNQMYSYCIKKLKEEDKKEAFIILNDYLKNMYKNNIINVLDYIYLRMYIFAKKMLKK